MENYNAESEGNIGRGRRPSSIFPSTRGIIILHILRCRVPIILLLYIIIISINIISICVHVLFDFL